MENFKKLGETSYLCNEIENTVGEYTHLATELEFVLIPAGTLEVNGQSIEIPAFLMSKYPVYQIVWYKVLGRNSSYVKGKRFPVEKMSWKDCLEFCEKTNFCIPKETEWEYACRAGATTKFYWGDSFSNEYCWNKVNSNRTSHIVGEKKPNAFGLHDMLGNVAELCQGQYDLYGGQAKDPYGKILDANCVKRGGGWNSYPDDCQCSSRNPEIEFSAKTGFRVCYYV